MQGNLLYHIFFFFSVEYSFIAFLTVSVCFGQLIIKNFRGCSFEWYYTMRFLHVIPSGSCFSHSISLSILNIILRLHHDIRNNISIQAAFTPQVKLLWKELLGIYAVKFEF